MTVQGSQQLYNTTPAHCIANSAHTNQCLPLLMSTRPTHRPDVMQHFGIFFAFHSTFNPLKKEVARTGILRSSS